MITVAGGNTYRTAEELNLQHYIELARAQVGNTYDLRFQSRAKWRQKAGEFEILGFDEQDAGWKKDSYYLERGREVIIGANLGIFTIRLHGTKLYNGKTMRFKVKAYVQDQDGLNDRLFISTVDENTGKGLRAYMFPILNWN